MTYDYETTAFCLDPLPLHLEWEMLPHIIPTSWSQCLPCFFFFFSRRAYSEPLPIVKCLKALVPYVMSVFLFVYSGRACLVPVLSQGQKWKPLYTDYRGRCIEEMIWMKKSGLINGAFWNESFCDFSGTWEVILSRNIHILLPGRMCRIEWWLFFSHMTLHYHLNLWYFAISVVRGGKGG